ncbi:MAG: hypothetical protein K2Y01_11440 [Rhabdochlamydiaceae bacterium]|nr:hypothetical protein [Rhabdochlamydiaceae bacterium]
MHLYLYFLIPVFLVLAGCQPTSLEDFQWEGSSYARILLKDLQKIESREDLSKIEPLLKKDFHKIVDVIIQARAFQQKNPEAEISFQNINPVLNASLREELKRVYEIEGGRECVERVQREAMLKLDAKERRIEKQSAFFPNK